MVAVVTVVEAVVVVIFVGGAGDVALLVEAFLLSVFSYDSCDSDK